MSEAVTDPDAVFTLARNLLARQKRLARLEEEKATIQAEIAADMNELTRLVEAVRLAAPDAPDAPEAHVPPEAPAPRPPAPPPPPRYPSADPRTLVGMLLGRLARNPGRAFNVDDLLRELGMKGERAKTNIRATLSRLARRGQIARGDYGKYLAKAVE